MSIIRQSINMRQVFVSAIVLASFALVGTQALAKTSATTKPGWGLGDLNHIHTGPPGQSVIPTISQQNNSTSNVNLSVSGNSGKNKVNNNSHGTFSTGDASANVSVNISSGNNSLTTP